MTESVKKIKSIFHELLMIMDPIWF